MASDNRIESGDWIDSYNRKGLTTGMSRPARDPVKIESFIAKK